MGLWDKIKGIFQKEEEPVKTTQYERVSKAEDVFGIPIKQTPFGYIQPTPTQPKPTPTPTPSKPTPRRRVSQAEDVFGIPIKQTPLGYIEPTPTKPKPTITQVQQLPPQVREAIIEKPILKPKTPEELAGPQLPLVPSKQLDLPTTSQLYGQQFGTRTDLGGPKFDYQIQTQPYITEKQIGEYRGVPIMKKVYIDPTVTGTQKERPVTQEEAIFYEQQKTQAKFDKIMRAGAFPNTPEGREAARRYIRRISRKTERKAKVEEFKAPIRESWKEMGKEFISEETKEKAREKIVEVLPYVAPIIRLLPDKAEEKFKRFYASTAVGLVPSTGKEVLGTVATFGLGTAVGAGVRLGEKGIGFTVKKIAPLITKDVAKVSKAVKVSTGTYKGLTTVGGAVLGATYVVGVGKQVAAAETPEEKGEIVGKGAREFILFGAGYGKGQKLVGKGMQWFKTRGLEKIEPPVREAVLKGKEIFPEAGKGLSQYERAQLHKTIFEKGEYVEPFKKLTTQELKLIKETPQKYAEFNYYNQLKFKGKSQFPRGHAYPHSSDVSLNIQKLMKAHPEYNKYWIKNYGSIANAQRELTKGGMWHDIMKVSAKSEKTNKHGQSFYDLWKAGKLPKEIQSIKPEVAKAIKIHDLPQKYAKTPEAKILMTADIIDLGRYGIKVEKLPLKGAREKIIEFKDMKLDYKAKEYTSGMEKIRKDFLKDYKIEKGAIIVPTEIPAPGIHLAPQKLAGEKITRPLHVSPEASIHFLGLGKKGEGYLKPLEYVKKMFEPTPEPLGYVITPKEYKIIKGREVERGVYRWDGKVEPGKAYITGEKTEIQAVFLPETKLVPTGKGAYFIYEGYRIPLKGFEAIGDKVPIKRGRKITEYERLIREAVSEVPSYPKVSFKAIPSYGPRVSKITPSYIPKVSYVPSVSKVTPSYVTSYKPSVSKVSYKPSKPSYKPSVSKVISSYKPSVSKVTPSYVPSVSKVTPSYISYVSKVTPSYVSKPSRPSYTPSRPSYRPSKASYIPSAPYSYKPSKPSAPPSLRREKRISKKVKKKPIRKGMGYEGSYRRFGKWISLSKGTRAKATASVKRKVKRELGASYKVKDLKTGKYIMPEITKQFRRSKAKKTPYVVVEKRKYRLDSPKEKREIKAAKRSKKSMFFK